MPVNYKDRMMAEEFKIPELGENVESGTVAKMLISEGDSIEKDQPVMELETEKAVLEVPSDIGGRVKEILVEEGAEVKVGDTVFVIESDGEPEQQDEEKKEKKPEEAKEEKKSAGAEEKPQEAEKEKPQEGKESAPDEKRAESQESKETEKPKEKAKLVEIKLQELGENVESGTVAGIMVSEGDHIQKDQGLLELETEKAAVEIPSEISGVIKEIMIEEGDEIRVGQALFKVESGAELEEREKPKEKAPEAKPEEAEKATEPEERTEAKKKAPEEKKPEKKKGPDRPAPEIEMEVKHDVAPAAPSVRRFAREIGIDINRVSGTGPGGRISINDVKKHSKMLNQRKTASSEVLRGIEAEKLPDFSKWGEVERKPMSKVRESTARHLGYAWATVAHVTQFDKADITELEKFRKQHGKKAEEQGGKLTATAIILKIVAAALKVFPKFNASIDMENREIIQKKYINIGIAVDTDRGLLVPVIRNVDKKNVIRLSVELTEVAKKAREAKLSLEDMQGGNFSISNLGGIGGTGFTPVVNSPDVAILGISRAQMEPVYHDGEFKPRLMLPLSLSYDHRLVDGADAARFLRWVAETIEQPFKFMLEG
jgi:pyruvate dehydrogenase E2 component (dihydrolipoamide acetyltransferase)